MKSIPLTLYVTAIGTALLIVTTLVVIVPELSSVSSKRQEVDSIRVSTAAVKKQLTNSAVENQNFTTLLRHKDVLNKLFLDQATTIDFFNTIDVVFEESGIRESNVRLDTPQQQAPLQVVGVHFTFAGTIDQTIKFLKKIQSLPTFLKIDEVKTSLSDPTNNLFDVQVDALVPWQEHQ